MQKPIDGPQKAQSRKQKAKNARKPAMRDGVPSNNENCETTSRIVSHSILCDHCSRAATSFCPQCRYIPLCDHCREDHVNKDCTVTCGQILGM
jgi:hypothetical protein